MSEPNPGRLARRAGECHILAGYGPDVGTRIASCGAACGTECAEALAFTLGMSMCSTHGEPICQSCREIVETYLTDGDWTGHAPPPGPRSPGLRVCSLPGCPDLTRGNYCPDHADLTPDEQAEEIRRLNPRPRGDQ